MLTKIDQHLVYKTRFSRPPIPVVFHGSCEFPTSRFSMRQIWDVQNILHGFPGQPCCICFWRLMIGLYHLNIESDHEALELFDLWFRFWLLLDVVWPCAFPHPDVYVSKCGLIGSEDYSNWIQLESCTPADSYWFVICCHVLSIFFPIRFGLNFIT